MTLPCSQVFKVEHSVTYLLITSVAQVRKDFSFYQSPNLHMAMPMR